MLAVFRDAAKSLSKKKVTFCSTHSKYCNLGMYFQEFKHIGLNFIFKQFFTNLLSCLKLRISSTFLLKRFINRQISFLFLCNNML